MTPIRNRLAVCSWSLQPETPEQLISRLKEIGLPGVQLGLDPFRENPATWSQAGEKIRAQGFQLVSGMIGFLGEDYSTMESIHATGGVAPDGTWNANWNNVMLAADLAALLGLSLVTFHAGFLPPDRQDPTHAKMLHRLGLIADEFAARKIDVAFETGQETAPVLLRFLEELGRPNVGVNFDPANIILYDHGDPVEALRALGPWLRQIHIKDGRRPKQPGIWGEEVVAGSGEVPWAEFFSTLKELNFQGHCCIEREAGRSRVEDIRTARRIVEELAR